jgi:ABC-2 type transport system ATP-binding protein
MAATISENGAGGGWVVETSGLTKRFGERVAVDHVDLEIPRGSAFGYLGPNGAGKTTLIRILLGLTKADSGTMRLLGKPVPGERAAALARVGAIVEEPSFHTHLTGRENLRIVAAAREPEAHNRIDGALARVGLADRANERVSKYSLGMRQRLGVARALLADPDLLILDEPTNGLDPPQIREMRDVMIRYAAGGRTVIVSSHLLSEVEQSCTHLVVMDRGRLVQAGPVAEITGESDTLLVTTAEEVPEPVVDKIAALPGIGSATRTDEGLLVRLDGATATGMIAELVRLDVPLTGVGPHRRLEDAFLNLIGGSA